MKRKWKYGKPFALHMAMTAPMLVVFFIFSCGNRDEHKGIPANKISGLDSLGQSVNQTVFSDVKTVSPIQQSITPVVNATGVISYDPLLLNTISARFSGRIEKLYVRFNFQSVAKGQRIMDVYSPAILTAQQNLIYLLSNSPNDVALLNSAKQELRLLGLTSEQIKHIETTKQLFNPIPIYSPYNGHIHDIGIGSGVRPSSGNNGMNAMSGSSSATSQMQIENLPSSQTSALSIKEGMYVESGQAIFAVYDISNVWAVLNIFQKDAALVKAGDQVSITAETNPRHAIEATISYIEPVTGENAYTIKARVYLHNSETLHLKIGTLVSAKITATDIKGMWLSRRSVIDLGQKQVVFLKTGSYFTTKTVHTGLITDSLVQIINGLKGDEMVADNAQFLVDSEGFVQTDDNEQK